jgi:hypothetical protein
LTLSYRCSTTHHAPLVRATHTYAVSDLSEHFWVVTSLSSSYALEYCLSWTTVTLSMRVSQLYPSRLFNQRVLHLAARLLYDLKPSDHVTPVLRDFHWYPIKERVNYKLCMIVHNVSTGRAPLYMSDRLTACADVPSLSRLRASSSGDYVVPRTRLRFGERAIAVAAPRIWYKLPCELKSTKFTFSFKRLLNKILFNSAYNAN